MNKITTALLSAVFFAAAGTIAFALSGDEILTRVEAGLTGPADFECLATMTLANKDGSKKEERSLLIWASGKEKQIIKFVTPAGLNGIALLTAGADEMYLYLPAQNKIRRIEGGSKNDDFQGTDFSFNEMGSYEYRNDYSAELTGDTNAAYTLVLTKKPGSARPYEKLVMTVDKPDFIPSRIELYRNNALRKVLTISEIKKSGEYTIPVKIKMENVAKSHYTEIVMSNVKFDQNLEANGIFSKRFLKKKP